VANAPDSAVSLRRTLSLRLGSLVLGIALLVAVGFALLGLRPMTARVVESQFSAAGVRVEATLSALFTPTEDLLQISRGWIGSEAPDVDRPESFNRQFQPLLEAIPQISSVVAGTSTGQGWMLLQHRDGHWSNRLTDVPRWGRRHLIFERFADGRTESRWKELDYEVRSRPWYQGAMAGATPSAIHWTAPYPLFTTGKPGVTASTRLRLADGRDFAIGFDILLRDLSGSTMKAQLGHQGLALVVADDGRVIALPAPPAGTDTEAWFGHLLQPAGTLGLAAVTDALAHWHHNGRRVAEVVPYRSGGQDWLARFQPYPLGEQRLWVIGLAPAGDFAPDWAPVVGTLAAGAAAVLLIALLVIRSQAQRIAAPLENLAEASRHPDQARELAAPGTAARIAEVEQLASVQAAMADLIQQDRQQLADQEGRLQAQLGALRESESKYRQLFDTANDGIFLQDETGFIDCNERGASMYGLSRQQVIGRSPLDFCPEHQPDGRRSAAVAREKVQAALAGRPQSFEWQPLRADGRRLDVEITLSRLELGGKPCLQAIVRDITERKQAAEAIRQLAYFDPLTALPNRRLLLDRLGHALLAGERSREFGALVMLDMDHFKILNDTQGHDAGDQLLVQVAQRLLGCVRREDTVARLGGDEYVVMLEGLGLEEQAAAHQAEMVAEKIRLSLNQPYLFQGGARDFHATASLGLTLFGQGAASADLLLKQADMALYKAKDAGRNAIRFYSPAMQAAIDEHVRMEDGLREALATGRLVLHYQPQIVSSDEHIVAVEALLRWQHPEAGLVMPDRFIAIAEQTGLILAIGAWVIGEACRQLAAWKAEGIGPLRMAVNLSARQLHDPGLLQHIQAALASNGLEGEELELEVTESTAMQDPEQAIALLCALRTAGVKLAIDDFGTGYSSLSHLRRLPIQTLKLDRSFVRDIESDGGDAAICAATIALAKNLNLQVVAEGVETEAQRYFLSTVHHCDLLQGYLFGKPLPAAEMLVRLRQGAGSRR
jgi:diguanylate cyclase (GGDEF)-like protein/PAS domain S-box-containing protein